MTHPTDTLALVCEHLADDLASLQLRRWPLPALGPADVRVAAPALHPGHGGHGHRAGSRPGQRLAAR